MENKSSKMIIWRNIDQYPFVDECRDVLLRVDYATRSTSDYFVGYVRGEGVFYHNPITESRGLICLISEIGEDKVKAVYFINPEEILK